MNTVRSLECGDGPGPGAGPAGRALVALALILVFVSQLTPIQGFDIFWHVAIGDWIVEHAGVPRTGLLSATMGDRPWVDHEWGFQVLVSAWGAMGWAGLVWLKALLVGIAFAVLAWCLVRRGLPYPAVALSVGLAWVAIGAPILRPQLVTYALLAAFLVGMSDLVDGRGGAARWYLPLLAFVWANLHGGFIVGLVVLAIPGGVELLRRLVGRPPGFRLGPLFGTLFLSTAAALVNPYGWRQIYQPIVYMTRPAMTSFNLEWQPTALSERPGLMLLFGAVFVAFALARRSVRLHDLALALAFAVLALQATRHVGLAALVLPVAAAPSAAGPVRAFFERGSRTARIATSLTIAALLVGAFLYRHDIPRTSPFRYLEERILLPARSTDFLLEHRPPGSLLNQYGWGGYLIFRFRPEAVVFVDGRNDLYGETFMADYLQIMEGGPEATALIDRYGVNTALLAYHANNANLIRRLIEAGWVCIHYDSESFVPIVVMVRNIAEAEPLIERFGIELPPVGERG